jgi:hypothetical protein
MRLFTYLKKEILHITPVFIFFFFAFNIINFTEGLILKKAGIVFTLVDVTLAAALIAKVLLILDHLPIMEFVPKRPLIFRVIWKSFLYWGITFIVRQVMKYFHEYIHSRDFVTAWDGYLYHLNADLMIAIQSWCLMLMVLFVTARELAHVMQPKKMRDIFFRK